MFHKVLVANRGAIAARLIRTLRRLNIKSVAAYSEADAGLPYLAEADETILIGPASARESYLNQDVLLQAARRFKVDAIHPGYGFLSENAQFASKLMEAGFHFIGPDPKWLRLLGDKIAAKKLMAERGMPVCPSTDVLTGSMEKQVETAAALGFPLLIKPVGGGGGIGMAQVNDRSALASAIESAAKLGAKSFSEASIYAERLVERPRHVEFQVLADHWGNAVHLFERDCSVQRRRQKVVEEAGAPAIPEAKLAFMARQAVSALSSLGYNHIGTVETLYSEETGFIFLEVNPRLQVEHAVTEEVSGVDLVATQVRLASNLPLAEVLPRHPERISGHAVEARIYAEDPLSFLPSSGVLEVFRPPSGRGIRVETGYGEGAHVTPFYDPMIAQVIVWAENRTSAIHTLYDALGDFSIRGVRTNIPFIRELLRYAPFREGRMIHTGLADEVQESLKKHYNA
ncbi:ATP-grasp domain-containing protein [Desulfococcaceae bacterium OttesenSCG-928-F15]|nr:ATP-grasp domain-containing protein [Desulfococcaceae bacterium OttesenSCG-928-F15]